MNVHEFYHQHVATQRPPTRRKILNALQRYAVQDDVSEWSWFLGAYLTIADIHTATQATRVKPHA